MDVQYTGMGEREGVYGRLFHDLRPARLVWQSLSQTRLVRGGGGWRTEDGNPPRRLGLPSQ